jgi:hypothetical protein
MESLGSAEKRGDRVNFCVEYLCVYATDKIQSNLYKNIKKKLDMSHGNYKNADTRNVLIREELTACKHNLGNYSELVP